MTAQPAPASDTVASNDAKQDPADALHPLSAFVRGTLTIHFDGGAVVTRQTAQLDARAFVNKQKDVETSDDVTWGTPRWFTWADERVVYSSFEAAADQNWAITPEDRRRLTDAGHPHGVITSLVHFWERKGRPDEPRYSLRVVVTLHHMALHGASRHVWEAAARLFEGPGGAEQVARVWSEAEGAAVDDETPPEEASAQPGPATRREEGDERTPEDAPGGDEAEPTTVDDEAPGDGEAPADPPA